MTRPQLFDDCRQTIDALLERVGPRISVGIPLGIGKPNHLVNELVRRAVDGELEHLEIFTALSLGIPKPSSELESRLMDPIVERVYAGYEDLEYVGMRARGELPDNVTIHEFYYPPGSLLGNAQAQQDYKSVNYTHALREMLRADLDVIMQLVAPGDSGGYDLSCNTDITIDLIPMVRERDESPVIVGQVNRRLPAMGGGAELDAEMFDMVLDDEAYDYELFAMPSMPPDDAEWAIGLRTAALLKDGGTLQVGIGSLGQAACWAAIRRHEHSSRFEEMLGELGVREATEQLIDVDGGTGRFDEGLYASTEMLVEGIMQLFEAGVLHRSVYDDLETQRAANAGDPPEEPGVVAHGGFYLGSRRFYQMLRELSDADRARIEMTGVRFTNLLYGQEELKRAQRKDARFVNEAMKVTLLGAVVSDGLADGRVVSGVGGQYEFVAMANELEDARSIIMTSATRESGGEVESNIVWQYGHVTIPRHLRDIIITEYGVADLRGKSDAKVIEELLCVADARFHEELIEKAQSAGKLPSDFQLPQWASQNTPQRIDGAIESFREAGDIPRTPFGSALTDLELDLADALDAVKDTLAQITSGKLPDIQLEHLMETASIPDEAAPYLERLGLAAPKGIEQRAYQRVVAYGLSRRGYI